MAITNKCCTCKSWHTSESLMRIYGEGEGRCSETGEITFCEKHNCSFYEDNEEGDAE